MNRALKLYVFEMLSIVVVANLFFGFSAFASEITDKDSKNQLSKTNDSRTMKSIPTDKSTAIFYGVNLPTDILSQYHRIIVESGNVKPEELKALRKNGSSVYAYVSIGKVSTTRKWFKQIKSKWILGENKVWGSKVMDLSSPGWQNFILDEVVTPLWDAGYRGLFLDTMDSFYLFTKNEKQREVQRKSLIDLFNKIHKRYPDMHFISNRGFEVMDAIGGKLEAVLAESLFASWDNVKKEYKETSKNDQEWLRTKLNNIKDKFSTDIIIIDYADPSDTEKVKNLASKIVQEGFIPWVSIVSLDIAGLGSIKPIINTHLLLIDSKKEGAEPLKQKPYKQLLKKLQTRGEQIKIHDIQTGMPVGHMTGRYIDIMTKLPFKVQSDAYKEWINKQIKEGVNFLPLLESAKQSKTR